MNKTLGDQFREHVLEENANEAAADVATKASAAVAASLLQAAAVARQYEGVASGEVPAAKQYFALGKICEMYQLPPKQVRQLMRDADCQWDHAVNDVPYATGETLVRLWRYIREQQSK